MDSDKNSQHAPIKKGSLLNCQTTTLGMDSDEDSQHTQIKRRKQSHEQHTSHCMDSVKTPQVKVVETCDQIISVEPPSQKMVEKTTYLNMMEQSQQLTAKAAIHIESTEKSQQQMVEATIHMESNENPQQQIVDANITVVSNENSQQQMEVATEKESQMKEVETTAQMDLIENSHQQALESTNEIDSDEQQAGSNIAASNQLSSQLQFLSTSFDMTSDDNDLVDLTELQTTACQTDILSRFSNCLSEEETNFLKFCHLVQKIAPQAVRCCFDKQFPVDQLDGIIRQHLTLLTELKRQRVITLAQWNLILPYGSKAKSADFDVTLMIFFISASDISSSTER